MKVKAQKEAQLKRGDNVMSLISTSDITANLDVRVCDLDVVCSLLLYFCNAYSLVPKFNLMFACHLKLKSSIQSLLFES